MRGIYGIFRKSDDRCMYVGQSSDIDGRIKKHLSGKSNTPFNKEEYYGEMIEEHMINNKQFRLEREAYWIAQLNPKLNKIKDETNRGEYYSGENNPFFSKHHSDESKNKMKENHADFSGENHPFFGKHHSEETNEKIRQGNLGKHLSDETKKKIGEAKKDTKWINNGQINKRINQDELDNYIRDGWKLGIIKT